ncbi:hypothetical protein [Methanococcoides sp. LMO-2]|uniref:Uncharacterized protein n=1 Tax=Methanococcoides cohabitans TaxID=3136559 RepID=A0ABU9KVM1_9EURY
MRKKISIGLLFAAFIVVLSSYFLSPYDWISGVLAGAGTELFGILLSVAIIEWLINKKEEDKRKKIEAIALKKLKSNLIIHLDFLFRLANDSGETKNVFKDFDGKYFDKINNLNMHEDAPVHPPKKLHEVIQFEFERLHDLNKNLIETYIYFMDEGIISYLEKLNSHDYMNLMSDLSVKCLFEKETGRQLFIISTDNYVEDYFKTLIDLCQYYNELVPFDKIVQINVNESMINGFII